MTSLSERNVVIALVNDAIVAGARQEQACDLIDLSERTLQRWKNDQASEIADRRTGRVQAPKNQLSPLERQQVLAIANSAEFGHLPPSQIVPRLADQGIYVASESTFYRVLKAENMLQYRGAEKPRKPRSKPRALQATQPNQLFSWDITYLPTEVKGVYFYLYMFIDIFSRKVVGWQVFENESSSLAGEVMKDICVRENIQPNQVVLHSDNGSPMKGATMLATLQMLGVIPSFSRPAVSNDNPYAESFFKTMKYRPAYPTHPFKDLLAARAWITTFMHWYNEEHRHSAIQFVTPAQRHAGLDVELLERREVLYEASKAKNPNRWRGPTRNWTRTAIVHLNPDDITKESFNQTEVYQELKMAA
jgi:transposase InsO family protein